LIQKLDAWIVPVGDVASPYLRDKWKVQNLILGECEGCADYPGEKRYQSAIQGDVVGYEDGVGNARKEYHFVLGKPLSWIRRIHDGNILEC